MALLKRYGEHAFFFNGRISPSTKAVFIDGMPTLFMAPLVGFKTFKDYTQFLLKRKVFRFFQESDEVHVVFDCPSIWGFNLKQKVQEGRDSKYKETPALETEEIDDSTLIPCTTSQWGSFLANRKNKEKLILYIGNQLEASKDRIPAGKTLIVAGCSKDGKTYMVQTGEKKEIPELYSNHEEADTRVFVHANWSKQPVVQIVAADTDVFAIALLNFHHFSGRTVLIDQSDNSRLLHMNALVDAMNEDQDTDVLVLRQRGEIGIPYFFGLIHPLIGSDILCSPRSFGAAVVLKACIDFSSYLFSGPKAIQNLANQDHDSKEAYARFILALFKKRYASKIKMPAIEMFANDAKIAEVLETVKTEVWVQTIENNTTLPTMECLVLRALNLSFQLKVWTQATKPLIEVPSPLQHGWEGDAEGMTMIPDTKENQEKHASVYKTIMKRCKCKKSQCKNGRCACYSTNQNCSSFCECENCCNPHAKETQKETQGEEGDSESEDSDGADGDAVTDEELSETELE